MRTYVRLSDPAFVDQVNRALPAYVLRRMTPPDVVKLFPAGSRIGLSLMPIGRMHLFPDQSYTTPPGSPALIVGLTAIAALILSAAVVNFVNLMTARAARRAVEVGIRKALGATHGQLIVQFIGEAVVYAATAAVLAICLVELLRPAVEGLMLRKIAFPYWRDAQLQAFTLFLVLLTGLAAGAYPAFVLSAFQPASALHGGRVCTTGSLLLR